MKNILLLTDNEELLNRFKTLIKDKSLDYNSEFSFNYAFSFNNKAFVEKFKHSDWIKPLKVKDEVDFLLGEYDMIFSLHCKQIFPSKLVSNVNCINVHPGLNPNN